MLSSIDYSELINWIAFNKFGVLLNKTQMQKILFMCYGVYLVNTSKHLFKDDTPKAWPFGPVFPRVNKRFTPGIPKNFSEDKQAVFLENQPAMRVILDVVKRFHNVSAHDLSEWSHQEGGPWHQTIYGKNGDNTNLKWNQVISDDLIKAYFNAQ